MSLLVVDLEWSLGGLQAWLDERPREEIGGWQVRAIAGLFVWALLHTAVQTKAVYESCPLLGQSRSTFRLWPSGPRATPTRATAQTDRRDESPDEHTHARTRGRGRRRPCCARGRFGRPNSNRLAVGRTTRGANGFNRTLAMQNNWSHLFSRSVLLSLSLFVCHRSISLYSH